MTDLEEDINYFKKKILNGVIDENWDAVIVAANRLKLLEDDLIVYRLTRNPERNVFCKPLEVYTIAIQTGDGKNTKWLHTGRWIGALPFCDEFTTREEAERKLNDGSLPVVPEGYALPYITKVNAMTEETKLDILGGDGTDLEASLEAK